MEDGEIDPHLTDNNIYDFGSRIMAVGDQMSALVLPGKNLTAAEPLGDAEGSVTFKPQEGMMPQEIGIMYMVLSSTIVLAFMVFSCYCGRKIVALTSDEGGGTPEFFASEVNKLMALRKNVLQLQVQLSNANNKNKNNGDGDDEDRSQGKVERILIDKPEQKSPKYFRKSLNKDRHSDTFTSQPSEQSSSKEANQPLFASDQQSSPKQTRRHHHHHRQQSKHRTESFVEQSAPSHQFHKRDRSRSPMRQIGKDYRAVNMVPSTENVYDMCLHCRPPAPSQAHAFATTGMLYDGDIIHPTNYLRHSTRSIHDCSDYYVDPTYQQPTSSSYQPSSAKSSPRVKHKRQQVNFPCILNSPVFRPSNPGEMAWQTQSMVVDTNGMVTSSLKRQSPKLIQATATMLPTLETQCCAMPYISSGTGSLPRAMPGGQVARQTPVMSARYQHSQTTATSEDVSDSNSREIQVPVTVTAKSHRSNSKKKQSSFKKQSNSNKSSADKSVNKPQHHSNCNNHDTSGKYPCLCAETLI